MKTRIIVKKENESKIMNVINGVQKGCRARTIDSVEEILDIITRAESDIFVAGTITKTSLEGTKIVYDQRSRFPGAYKGIPMSTYVILEYHVRKWYLTSVGRARCDLGGYKYGILLSETAKTAVIRNIERT